MGSIQQRLSDANDAGIKFLEGLALPPVPTAAEESALFNEYMTDYAQKMSTPISYQTTTNYTPATRFFTGAEAPNPIPLNPINLSGLPSTQYYIDKERAEAEKKYYGMFEDEVNKYYDQYGKRMKLTPLINFAYHLFGKTAPFSNLPSKEATLSAGRSLFNA